MNLPAETTAYRVSKEDEPKGWVGCIGWCALPVVCEALQNLVKATMD